MSFDAYEFLSNPIENMLSPFLDSALGVGSILVVLCFITIAIYLKTKSVYSVGAFIIVFSMLFAGVGIFTGMYYLSILFSCIIVLIFVSIVIEIIIRR